MLEICWRALWALILPFLSEGASNLLEVALGSYSSAFLLHWHLPGSFDAESAAQGVAREPDVWTDGSMVEDKVSGSSSAGAGFSTGHSGRLWAERSWGHIDDGLHENEIVSSCRGYCSLVLYSLFSGLSYGVSFLLCRPLVVCIWVLIT